MSGLDADLQLAGRKPATVPERDPAMNGGPTHAQELASRAVADGRPDALDPLSIVHLQSLAGNASVSRLIDDAAASDMVRSVVGRGGGEPLPSDIAGSMGARLGADLGDVRIHRGGAAAQSAKAVNAHAYTVGSDVVFGAGQYDPSSPAGQRTIAHELSHVVQQRTGAVSGTRIGGGLAMSHPLDAFEQEASRTADRVVSGAAPVAPATAQRHATDDEAVAQRAAGPDADEEEEQGQVAQRAGGTEDDEDEQTAQRQVAQRATTPEEEEEPTAT